jgi:hypothetical protein
VYFGYPNFGSKHSLNRLSICLPDWNGSAPACVGLQDLHPRAANGRSRLTSPLHRPCASRCHLAPRRRRQHSGPLAGTLASRNDEDTRDHRARFSGVLPPSQITRRPSVQNKCHKERRSRPYLDAKFWHQKATFDTMQKEDSPSHQNVGTCIKY